MIITQSLLQTSVDLHSEFVANDSTKPTILCTFNCKKMEKNCRLKSYVRAIVFYLLQ